MSRQYSLPLCWVQKRLSIKANNLQNKKAIKTCDKSSGFVTKFVSKVYHYIVREVPTGKAKIHWFLFSKDYFMLT